MDTSRLCFPDRRQHPRYIVNDRVDITVLSSPRLTQIQGLTTDISKEGLSILIDQPIAPGSTIEIGLRRIVIIGEVKTCIEANGQYRMGIVITDMRDARAEPPTNSRLRQVESFRLFKGRI